MDNLANAHGDPVDARALIASGGAFFWLLEPGSPADIFELHAICAAAAKLEAHGFPARVIAPVPMASHDGSLCPGVRYYADPDAVLATDLGVLALAETRYGARVHRAVVLVSAGGSLIYRQRLIDVEIGIDELVRVLSEAYPKMDASDPALQVPKQEPRLPHTFGGSTRT